MLETQGSASPKGPFTPTVPYMGICTSDTPGRYAICDSFRTRAHTVIGRNFVILGIYGLKQCLFKGYKTLLEPFGGTLTRPLFSLVRHWIAFAMWYSTSSVGMGTPAFFPALSGSPTRFSNSIQLPCELSACLLCPSVWLDRFANAPFRDLAAYSASDSSLADQC